MWKNCILGYWSHVVWLQKFKDIFGYRNIYKSWNLLFFLLCKLQKMNSNHVWLNKQEKSHDLAAHKSFSLSKLLLCYLLGFTNVCQHLKRHLSSHPSTVSTRQNQSTDRSRPWKKDYYYTLMNVQCNYLFRTSGAMWSLPPLRPLLSLSTGRAPLKADTPSCDTSRMTRSCFHTRARTPS